METDLFGIATAREREYLEAVGRLGVDDAAKELGVSDSTVRRAMRELKARAKKTGNVVTQCTTQYSGDGSVKNKWVKTRAKGAEHKALEAVAEAIARDVSGKAPKNLKDGQHENLRRLLTVYPIGDPHLGMMSWGEEAGENFDLDIAYKANLRAVETLVGSGPPTETAVILNLGDFFHSDNQSNRTARQGNALDVDGRWAKIMQSGADLMVKMIGAALAWHDKVIVKNLIGNHDDHSSYALSLILDAYYSNNDRVEIDLSPAMFWYYRFGANLIGATHGHTVKPAQLPTIMAEDRAADWGQTKHRYWYIGHIHQKSVTEIGSSIIESFRTLAAKDAWSASMGYRSGRDINSIILDKHFGEIARHRVDICRVT